MSRFGDLLGVTPKPTPAPEPVVEKVAPVVEKTPVKKTSDVSLESMSKKELESYGRTVGVGLGFYSVNEVIL